MGRITALMAASLVIGVGLATGTDPAVANDGDDDDRRGKTRVVDCTKSGAGIQKAVDKAKSGEATTIFIEGTCSEDVLIAKDDITLNGDPDGTGLQGGDGTIVGSVTFDGARRGAVVNLTVTGPGPGIVADNAASIRVENSIVADNGDASDDYSPGIGVFNGSFARISGNAVSGNAADGIGVYTGATAIITGNLITGNGRPSHGEAGIGVGRAHARGQSNVIVDNRYAALSVFNDGSYRTGSFLTSATRPDNDGPFETISAGTAGVLAVEMAQMSYVDLRQVNITGDVSVGRQSMLQVRGDNVGTSRTCSTINGNLSVFGFNSGARLRAVNVTGTVNGTIDGSRFCP